MTFSIASLLIFMPILVLVLISAGARTLHFYLFEKQFHVSFADAPVYSLFYFSAWSVVVALLFPSHVRELFAHVTLIHYLFLTFLFLVVFPILFHATRKQDGRAEWLLRLSPGEGMLTLGEQYILAKIGDVVFQQLIAGVMILSLMQKGVSYPITVGIFVALFAAAHLYIFRTSGMFWGIYYTTYASLGGFVFTFLITFISTGIVYALIIHMLFYVLSGVLFAKMPRPSKAMHHDLTGPGPALTV